MGSVWLAERNDGRFERRVAVKFLNIALMGKGGEERFKREGRILALLVHPHIAELIDAGVSQAGQPYLVLEHIEGDHIDRYCDQHRLPVEARIRLFLDVLRAVAKAHANLIVHRDLKPSNVLVRNDGQAKLLDFGIAKLLEGEGQAGDAQLTVEGGRAMTPECAAPEQLRGEANHNRDRCLCFRRAALRAVDRATSRGERTAHRRGSGQGDRGHGADATFGCRDFPAARTSRSPSTMLPDVARLPTSLAGCCAETSTRLCEGAEERTSGAVFFGHGPGRRSSVAT